MNIVQLQEQLKNFSQDQLVREMQMPSGTAPQFLVLGEIMRRQKMQQEFSAQQGKGQPQTTVAEDAIAAAGVPQGGIASMARALAPQTDMAGSTGVQAMATGGPVQKMKKGGDTYLPGLSDEDRRKVMAAADARAGLHPLYMLVKAEAEARGVSPEAAMNAFFGQAAGSYGSPVDSGIYPAPAASAAPEFLPGLSEEERQKVMLGADMRALGRRSYLAGQADKQGVSPEALMGRYGLYETGLAPAPENPAGPQQRYRDELIANARGMDTAGPYSYLFDRGGANMTSANPSYTENGAGRFPEEAPRLPISGYSLPRPDEMTSYERRQNSELEQPRSWFRDQQKEIATEIKWLERLLEVDPTNRYAAERLRELTDAEVQGMATGGSVQKMQKGGDIVVRNGKRYIQMPDGTMVDEASGQPLNAYERMMLDSAEAAPGLSLAQMDALGPTAPTLDRRAQFEPIGPSDQAAMAQALPESQRSWGQRNIGDPLRDFFQPFRENAPQFVLGPPPEEPPALLARQAQFEPTGESDQEALTRARMANLLPVNEVTGIVDPEVAREKGLLSPEQEALLFGRADRDQQGGPTPAVKTAEEIAAEKAAAEETAATEDTTLPPTPPGGGTGGTGGTGGVAGLGGVSSYEQELIDALNRREKAAEQDKWLALAQVGLNLMASTQPTLAGALGEAGLKGVEAARAARDQYDKDRLELTGNLEQLRMARAAASAKAARGGGGGVAGIGGLGIKDLLGQLKNVAGVAEAQLNTITGGMDPQQVIAAAREAGDNGRASEVKAALDATIAAQNDYMNAVRYIGGMGATAVDDELNVEAADE